MHMIKLKELPAPLNMLEFRQILTEKNLPIELQHSSRSKRPKRGELLDFENAKQLKKRRLQDQWNDVGSNLFGAYMDIFNLFKSWHNGIITQRDMGPKNVSEHVLSQMPRPPFLGRVRPTLT